MNSVKERLPFLLEGYLAAFALANIGGIATTNIITLFFFCCVSSFSSMLPAGKGSARFLRMGRSWFMGAARGSGGQRRWSWVFFIRSVMLRRRMGN